MQLLPLPPYLSSQSYVHPVSLLLCFTNWTLSQSGPCTVEEMIGNFSNVISSLVSCTRVDQFLQEKDTTRFSTAASQPEEGEADIGFVNASFSWSAGDRLDGRDSGNVQLRNLSLSFKSGGLNLIIGPVASVSLPVPVHARFHSRVLSLLHFFNRVRPASFMHFSARCTVWEANITFPAPSSAKLETIPDKVSRIRLPSVRKLHGYKMTAFETTSSLARLIIILVTKRCYMRAPCYQIWPPWNTGIRRRLERKAQLCQEVKRLESVWLVLFTPRHGHCSWMMSCQPLSESVQAQPCVHVADAD